MPPSSSSAHRTLSSRVLAGDQAAVARAISLLESGSPDGARLDDELFAAAGAGRTIGITGPPGAGKSSLVDGLVTELRARGLQLAVLAVDPSSPKRGGALLGDRVRMARAGADAEVFIRSVASRGALGGLASVVPPASRVLQAAGFDVVLVETVGVGQSEVDVATATDCTLLVAVPGAGDMVQALKSGIMEIADVCVVNKSDLPGAEGVEQDLRAAIAMSCEVPVPTLRVSARTGDGLPRLATMLLEFRRPADAASGLPDRREQLLAEVERLLAIQGREMMKDAFGADRFRSQVDALIAGTIGPHALVAEVLEETFGRPQPRD